VTKLMRGDWPGFVIETLEKDRKRRSGGGGGIRDGTATSLPTSVAGAIETTSR